MTPRRLLHRADRLWAATLAVALASACGGSSQGDACTTDDDCTDHLPCNGAETCLAGRCAAGVPVTCQPQDACHEAGTCSDETGLCSQPVSADGKSCDDKDACTSADACSGGVCRGTNVDCAVMACHAVGICNPSTGQCEAEPLPDGTECDDDDACTIGDACVAGECKSSSTVVCAAVDSCHLAGTCDPATGTCSKPLRPDGSSCEDGSKCTEADTCVAGTCTGKPVICPALDGCHQVGTCKPDTGLCAPGPAKQDGIACDDGNPCSTTSACLAGACAPTGTLDDGADCDDQDTCSVTSTCQAGQCAPVASVPDDTPCNDGTVCSVIDTCRAGHCQGHHAPMCSTNPNMCPVSGSCVPSCGDGVLAATEACDLGAASVDGCTSDCKLAVAPSDFDLSGVGSVFAVYLASGKLMGRCFWPSGEARGAAFEIASGVLGSPQVVVARDTGHALVSYLASAGSGASAHTSRLYDAACQPLGPAFAWNVPPGSQSAFDTAIDHNGNSVMLWTQYAAGKSSALLAFYDATGAQQGANLVVDSADRCRSSYGMRVVVAPSSGFGVVTCQGHASDPIYYRRFHDRAFTDGAMLVVPGTQQHSSWYQSHSVGMNDAGDFLIVWQDYSLHAYEAALLSSSAGLVKSFRLGWDLGWGYDGFPRGDRTIQLYGSGFAVVSGDTSSRIVRLVSSTGTITGCDTEDGALLRTGGLEVSYTYQDGIQRGSVDFLSWNGCSRPTCGNGVPDPGEQCDDGNRQSLDGCDEYCKTEYCGDGLVTDGESCDPGSALPTSTCTSTCQLTGQTPAITDQFPPGTLDFDVAADGSLIDTRVEDQRVWVRCYGPDRKPLREAFPVSPVRAYTSAQVVMAWTSKRALVAWPQGGKLWGALLDAQCKRVGSPRELVSNADDDENWEVAMDGSGRFAAIAHGSDGQMRIGMFDVAGSRIGSEEVTSFNDSLFGAHVAMNRVSGGGVVTVQEHSGPNAVFYRRFDASGAWTDPAFVTVPVDYVYWYYGHTVGMNGLGEFVVLYRAENGPMKAVFYSAVGVATGPVTFSTRVRTGESTFHDSFRGYRAPVPLKGNDFVLGEVYQSTSVDAERTTRYFVYTPTGTLVSSYESQWSDGRLTARLDGNGVSYFGESRTIYFGTGRL